MNIQETCDTCGQTFAKRDVLIKHIVDNHTLRGIQQQQCLQAQGGMVQQGQGEQCHKGGQQGWNQQGGGQQGGQQQGGGQQWGQQLGGGKQGGQKQGGYRSDEWLQRFKCQHCRYESNSQNELEYHGESIHKQANNICYRCKSELNDTNTKDNHVCRLPQDDSDNTCNFCKNQFFSRVEKINHICKNHKFKTVVQQQREKRRANIECNNGADCWRAATNRCWFKHSPLVNVLPQTEQGHGLSHSGARELPQRWCQYQENCFKGEQSCRFKHFNQGFLQNHIPKTNK